MEFYFEKELYRKFGPSIFSEYICVPSKNDDDRLRFSSIFKEMIEEENFTPVLLGLTQR